MKRLNQSNEYLFGKSKQEDIDQISDERTSFPKFQKMQRGLRTESGCNILAYDHDAEDKFSFAIPLGKEHMIPKTENSFIQYEMNDFEDSVPILLIPQTTLVKDSERQSFDSERTSEERRRIVQAYKGLCQKVISNEKKKNNKIWRYLSKNLYKNLKNEAKKHNWVGGGSNGKQEQILKLNHDQKKSIQCNLIYNVLQYLGWISITDYLKRKRDKIKLLKARTFYEQIFEGTLFRNEENRQTYRITYKMIKQSYQKLTEDRDQIFQKLFEKNSYIKIYENSKQQYKQRVLVAIFKLIQFIQMLIQQLELQLELSKKEQESYDFTEEEANIQQSLEPELQRIFGGGELQARVSISNQQYQHVLQIQNQISSNSSELENIEQWSYKLSLPKDY